VFAAQPAWRRVGPEALPGPDAGDLRQFNEWREKFRDNLTDLGGRLGAGQLVAPEPAPDGPFIEVKELVGGYMIVSADSLEEAADIARGCPGLVRPGSGVEVIEIHAPG
jgi:hypothetical protein